MTEAVIALAKHFQLRGPKPKPCA